MNFKLLLQKLPLLLSACVNYKWASSSQVFQSRLRLGRGKKEGEGVRRKEEIIEEGGGKEDRKHGIRVS